MNFRRENPVVLKITLSNSDSNLGEFARDNFHHAGNKQINVKTRAMK